MTRQEGWEGLSRNTAKPAQAQAELKKQQRKNEVLAGTEFNMAGIRGVCETVGTCTRPTWVHRDMQVKVGGASSVLAAWA